MKTKSILLLMTLLSIFLISSLNPNLYAKEKKRSKNETVVPSEVSVDLSTIYEQNKQILNNQQRIFEEIDFIKVELKRIKNRL